jgi:hypothetical protein
MVSIYRVYNTLKNLANKEQKGFVTPEVFNSFAHIAQLNVFNEIMNEQIEAKKLAKAGVDVGTVLSMKERKSEDMSYFYKKVKSQASDQSSISKPADLYKIVYITFEDTNESNVQDLDSDYGKCEIVYNPVFFEELKISRLSAPTDQYKVALIGSDKIEVWPADNTEEYWLHYYSTPGSYQNSASINNSIAGTRVTLPPVYSISLVQGIESYNPFSSRDFDLPPGYEAELIGEIAGMIGLNLRDNDVQQYAQAKTAVE